MYRSGIILAVLVAVGISVGLAVAADGGNAKKGKYLWKTNCKVCHVEGAEGGVLSPSTKTIKYWSDFFDTKNAKAAIEEKCKKFPEANLKDIRQYTIEHAKDSDQPETCGG
jgi:hypothetical protein